jgi:hypothetical protein
VEDFWIDRKKRAYFACLTAIGGPLLLVGQPWAIGMFGVGASALVISGG